MSQPQDHSDGGVYDDPSFFARYAEMPRSRGGLAAAGEWPALERLLPSLAGRDVLDLGAGYGWHAAYAAAQGARSVLAVDRSARMLERAAAQHGHSAIRYRRADIAALRCEPASFDVILSSLALHYIADLDALFRRCHDWLRPGGELVFSIEHPIFTASGQQDWYRDASGEILHFAVDRYGEEGPRTVDFLGAEVEKQHHRLETLLMGPLTAGFQLRAASEPLPPPELAALPGMRDEWRRPMMLILAWTRP